MSSSSSVPSSKPTRADDSEVRSFLGEEWVLTIRFHVGVVLALLGLLLAGGGVLFDWNVGMVDDVLVTYFHVGAAVFLVGVIALWGCRLSKRQRQYLIRAKREREEIRSYLSFLKDLETGYGGEEAASSSRGDPEPTDHHETSDEDEAEDGDEESSTDGGRSGEGPGSLRELRSRLRLALEDLEEARRAVYRRNYATFFSLYYDASRQEILLYDLLDEYAGGWAFGLGDGEPAGDDPDRVASPGPEPHRRRNLSRRISSFAEGTLPEEQLVLVREYLGGPDALPTPWQLYYAVRILHEWNVSQYETALNVKRFLRRFTVALLLVLVGLAAVLVLAFPDEGFLRAANATSSEATRLTTDSIVLDDSFLVIVVLAGALGAIISVIRDFDWQGFTTTTDPTVTEPAQMVEWFLARIVFGSVSALFLFVLARSDLGAVVLAEDLLESPLALLLIAFVAGFSENLILQLLSDIVGRLSPRDSNGPNLGGGTAREEPSGGDGPASGVRTGEENDRSGARETRTESEGDDGDGARDTGTESEEDDGDDARDTETESDEGEGDDRGGAREPETETESEENDRRGDPSGSS